MTFRSIAAVVPLLMTWTAQAGPAPGDQDRYGHMHMVLERTWFKVDVARVDVWVGSATRDTLRQLAGGQRFSDELAEKIARAAMLAPEVDVQLEFLRNAPLGQFLDAVHDNLAHARDAHYITADTFATAWKSVQSDFGGLKDRGIKRGDKLSYRARGDALQTVLVSGDRVVLDVTSRDPGARPSMIAGYLAPGTDCRKGLIKSLF